MNSGDDMENSLGSCFNFASVQEQSFYFLCFCLQQHVLPGIVLKATQATPMDIVHLGQMFG